MATTPEKGGAEGKKFASKLEIIALAFTKYYKVYTFALHANWQAQRTRQVAAILINTL